MLEPIQGEAGVFVASDAFLRDLRALTKREGILLILDEIQTGIGRLALRFRHSGSMLIAILMGIFAIGGTTYGMWEETLGFFVLLVPLTLALRFDRMVAAAIVFLGAGSGVIGSTVNPFSTGVASDAAGISIGDGIGLRIALWLVVVSMGVLYVIWYARRVSAHPEKSVVGVSRADASDAEGLIKAGRSSSWRCSAARSCS